jgi:hypothetical protein
MATHFKGPVVSENGFTGDITGDITGNITGDVTGNLTGNVTGDVTGDVTGNVTGDVTGNLTGNVTGNVTGNLTGNVTGNLTGAVTGTTVSASTSMTVGSGGSAITKMQRFAPSVTVTALAAGAEEEYTLTCTGVLEGDSIVVNPANAAAEIGLAVVLAWVSAADTVKVRATNTEAAGNLTGSTSNWNILAVRS